MERKIKELEDLATNKDREAAGAQKRLEKKHREQLQMELDAYEDERERLHNDNQKIKT